MSAQRRTPEISRVSCDFDVQYHVSVHVGNSAVASDPTQRQPDVTLSDSAQGGHAITLSCNLHLALNHQFAVKTCTKVLVWDPPQWY